MFGKPVSPFEFQGIPSGDEGIGLVYYAENASYKGGEKGNELQGHLGQSYIKMDSNQGSEISFNVKAEVKGDYFVRSRYSYSVLENGESEQGAPLHEALPVKGSMSVYVNDVFVCKAEFDKTGTDWDRYMYQGQRLVLKAGSNKITYRVDENDSGDIQFDYIAVQKIDDKKDQKDSLINIIILIGISVSTFLVGAAVFFIIRKRIVKRYIFSDI